MICPHYATVNPSHATSCIQCGTALDQSEAAHSSENASSPLSKPSPRPESEANRPGLSKFALLSLVCAIATWVCVVYGFFLHYDPLLLLIAIFIAFFSAINCGQVALVETGYVQRNKTSFWIAVVSLFIGYFVLVDYLAVLINVFSNWE
jgi:hypothetical protein